MTLIPLILIVIYLIVIVGIISFAKNKGKFKDEYRFKINGKDIGNDVSCKTLFGHHHDPITSEEYNEDKTSSIIDYPKAEEGYVILNGVKRRIEDCKNL